MRCKNIIKMPINLDTKFLSLEEAIGIISLENPSTAFLQKSEVFSTLAKNDIPRNPDHSGKFYKLSQSEEAITSSPATEGECRSSNILILPNIDAYEPDKYLPAIAKQVTGTTGINLEDTPAISYLYQDTENGMRVHSYKFYADPNYFSPEAENIAKEFLLSKCKTKEGSFITADEFPEVTILAPSQGGAVSEMVENAFYDQIKRHYSKQNIEKIFSKVRAISFAGAAPPLNLDGKETDRPQFQKLGIFYERDNILGVIPSHCWLNNLAAKHFEENPTDEVFLLKSDKGAYLMVRDGHIPDSTGEGKDIKVNYGGHAVGFICQYINNHTGKIAGTDLTPRELFLKFANGEVTIDEVKLKATNNLGKEEFNELRSTRTFGKYQNRTADILTAQIAATNAAEAAKKSSQAAAVTT